MTEFLLRPWQETDAASLQKHANNSDIAKNMTDEFPHPFTTENANAFIQNVTAHNPTRIFAIVVNGEAVGSIGIHPQTDIMRKNAEIGYWLSQDFWGQKIISCAIPQMVKFAFSTFDVYRIYARVYGPNLASQKAVLRAGFQEEAVFKQVVFKNNEFLDQHFFGIRRP